MEGFSHWLDVMAAAIGSFIAAVLGVVMRYTHAIQRGEAVNWKRIWLDGPTIFVMGLAGYAAHVYYGVPEVVGYVGSSLLGYLGPSAINRLVEFIEQRAKK